MNWKDAGGGQCGSVGTCRAWGEEAAEQRGSWEICVVGSPFILIIIISIKNFTNSPA